MAAGRPRTDRLRSAARRRARVLVETFLAVSLAGAALAFLLPSQYQSEAILQGGSPTQVAETITAGATRTTIESVVDDFGLVAGAPGSASRERTIAAARNNTALEVVGGSGLRVSFTAADPALSQRVTQRLAERLVEGITRNKPAADQGLLDAEVAQAGQLLAEKRERLEEYRRAHPTDTPAQLADTSRALRNAQAQARQLSETIARDREELSKATAPRSSGAEAAASDREARTAQLTAARATLAELETRLTPAHPDVVRQRGLVRELEQSIARETAPRRAPPVNEAAVKVLTDRIAARELQLARLQRSINVMRSSVARAPAQSAELEALQADHDALERLHASLTTKAQVLSASGFGGAEPMRLVSAATLPDSPISPNRRRILLYSLAAAVLLAIAVAGVREARDVAIYDEDDLRTLTDAPLLGVISEVLSPERTASVRARTLMRNVLAPIGAIVLVAAWWWAR